MSRYSGATCRQGHPISTQVFNIGDRAAGDADFGSILGTNEEVPRFCGKCGSAVLFQCLNCEQPLPGFNGPFTPGYEPSGFCTGCGQPHPWASRADRIGRLRNLLDDEPGLAEPDRLRLVDEIEILRRPEADVPEGRRISAATNLAAQAPQAVQAMATDLRELVAASVATAFGISAASP